LAVLLLGAVGCAESDEPTPSEAGVLQEINGVYTAFTEAATSTEEFSWGQGEYVPQGSLVIDLGATAPYVREPGFRYDVVTFEAVDEQTVSMALEIESGSREGPLRFTAVFHILESGAIWIESTPSYLVIERDRPLTRISGP